MVRAIVGEIVAIGPAFSGLEPLFGVSSGLFSEILLFGSILGDPKCTQRGWSPF